MRRTLDAEIAACSRGFDRFWIVIGLIVAGSRARRSYLHATFEVKTPGPACGACRRPPKRNPDARRRSIDVRCRCNRSGSHAALHDAVAQYGLRRAMEDSDEHHRARRFARRLPPAHRPRARCLLRAGSCAATPSATRAALSSTSGAATVMLANAGNQEQDRCARNDLFERAAAAVALEQVG
ncbi:MULTISPECIES: hypothetical protein [Burkholderia]|uniref:hypothetical protein n=1 Tax=Burkholderia TaxID=32008 RepID=UPI00163ABB8A|nr:MULTISPECIES: hypothetical protein [Burkholderia]MBN3737155.1 hypothetical protein [Burkholderia sp. Tr-20355]